jgi:hypothetical protein
MGMCKECGKKAQGNQGLDHRYWCPKFTPASDPRDAEIARLRARLAEVERERDEVAASARLTTANLRDCVKNLEAERTAAIDMWTKAGVALAVHHMSTLTEYAANINLEIRSLLRERDEARALHRMAEESVERKRAYIRAVDDRLVAAIAACAEMRAALEAAAIDTACHCDEAYTSRGRHEPNAPCLTSEDIRALLARTDLGAGLVVVPREVVERWHKDLNDSALTVAQYGDTIDARVLKVIDDLDAVLKKGGA